MSWIDIVSNNKFLKMLFPNSDPSLDAIRLHEVILHQDGPKVSLRFDLNEYPALPPSKWQVTGSNTVQVCLDGIGVKALTISGWAVDNIGYLAIESHSGAVKVVFNANECQIVAIFDFLSLQRVSAYHNRSA
jgi:hypothetical protein